MDSIAELSGNVTRSYDPLVRRYKAYLDFIKLRVRPLEAFKRLNYPLSFCHEIYSTVHPSCIRHAVEAAVLARAPDNYYTTHIHPALTKDVVDLYCALFFDVRKKLGAAFWMERHVFMPADAIQDDKVRQSDLIWKKAGYIGGPDRLLKEGLSSNIYDKDDFAWITSMAATTTARRVLNRAHSSDRLLLEAGASAEAGIAKTWLETKTEEPENSNALENPALEALARVVSEQLVMLEPSALDGAEERFEGKVKTY